MTASRARNTAIVVAALGVAGLAVFGLQHRRGRATGPTASATTLETASPTPPTAAAAQVGVPMPDPRLTPGAVLADATAQRVCVAGYSSSVRNVPAGEKAEVYRRYGIAAHAPGQYEVDHLISLELGGSNDLTNLWPEPYDGPDGAHTKDHLENWLHAQVCAGRTTLADAQHEIASNWYATWVAAGQP